MSDGYWTYCLRETCEQLERELAEARGVLVYEQGGIHATAGGWAAKYAEAVEQRDALAESLRNLANEIGRHESAIWMHPRLTRAIAAANRLTNETK